VITTSQVSVNSSTVPVALCTVPPGPCSVILTNSGTTAVVYGPGTATATGGAIIPAGAFVSFSGYQGSKGAALTAVLATGSTAASVGVLISSGQ
jgi:hypothetical protein